MVQGVAEVLPVSSSAQLRLLPWLLRWPVPAEATTYAAGLHAGSCLGIGFALRRDLRGLDRRTTGLLLVSTVPAAAAGLLAQDRVERALGRPGPTAVLLAGAGVALWAADRRPETVTVVGGREAAAAALAQVLALAPGVSRFGATLTALRLLQVDRGQAQRFSLLMSLPVTAGAAGLTLLGSSRRLVPSTSGGRSGADLRGPLLVGAPLAAVAGGLLAARQPGPRSVAVAAVYRLGVAAAVGVRLVRLRSAAPLLRPPHPPHKEHP